MPRVDTGAPAQGNPCEAVSGLAVTATSSTAVTLSWTGAEGVAVQVRRETYCGTDSYITLTNLPAGSKTYTDTSVQASWVYWYEIVATSGSASASAAIATQAAATPEASCSGGEPGRASGASTSSCTGSADAGDGGGPSTDAAPDSGALGHDAGAAIDSGVMLVDAFYVSTTGNDTWPGTLAEPFLTLTKAQSAMQASTTIKTTYVRAGSYTIAGQDCGSGGTCGLNLGSSDQGETWSYYPPDGVDSADLFGSATSASSGLTSIVYIGAGHITINGLSFHGFTYAGLNSNGGGDGLLIENNVFYDGYYASNNSNPGAISFLDSPNTTISHNVVHDIAMLGISVIATTTNKNISNLLITGNVLYNTCTANADCGAIYVQDVTATQTNIKVTNNYVHDGNTFATLGSNYGAGLYLDDCTSNVTESGNVVTGRNGSNTMMIHGGSNDHIVGNIVDLGTYAQHVGVLQASGASGCASAEMSGNEIENNIVIGGGGGGGYAFLSGSPQHTPTITDNDYYSYGSSSISSGSGSYGDSAPSSVNPELSGYTYTVASGSPVLSSPVSFTALVGGWGPPGYVLPETGTPPSSPH
jgi:hypothetical protein